MAFAPRLPGTPTERGPLNPRNPMPQQPRPRGPIAPHQGTSIVPGGAPADPWNRATPRTPTSQPIGSEIGGGVGIGRAFTGSSTGPPAQTPGGPMTQVGGPTQLPNGGGGGVWSVISGQTSQGSPVPVGTVPPGGPQIPPVPVTGGPLSPWPGGPDTWPTGTPGAETPFPAGGFTPAPPSGGGAPAGQPEQPMPVSAGPGQTPQSTGQQPAGQPTFVPHTTIPNFGSDLNPGDPVEGQPGLVWQYGQAGQYGPQIGWYQVPAGYQPGQQPGQPGAPGQPAPPATPPDYRDPAAPPQTLPPGQQVTGQAPQVGTQPGGPQAGTSQQQLQNAVQQALLQQLGQNPYDVHAGSADVRPQADAYARARTRAADQQRSAMAERLSAQGLDDSGYMDTELGSIQESAGEDIASNEAQLVGEALERRREDLSRAMQMAQQQGQFDQAERLQRELSNVDAQLRQSGIDVSRESLGLQRDLGRLDAQTRTYLGNLDAQLRREGYSTQERLAALDAEIRRHGIDTQGNLGALDIALRRELGIGGLNLGLMEALMQNNQFGQSLGFNYAQLGQQGQLGQGQLNLGLLQALLGNQQFNDQLGFDIGQYETELNNSLLSQLGG